MTNGYSYNPQGGLDTGDDLIALTKRMEQSLSELQRAAQAFMSANEGEAPGNYSIAQAEWNAGQQAMNAAMGKGVVALNTIHNEILNGDRMGAAQFQ